jgi:hypothetical protein
MKPTPMRNHNGRFTSVETERRRAWAAIRHDNSRASLLPGMGNMTFVEHLGLLQRMLEAKKEPQR